MMTQHASRILIPRTSQQQRAYGTRIPASQVRPGDLVFVAGAGGTLTAARHVGIVVGPGLMIDAPTQRDRPHRALQQPPWPGRIHPPNARHAPPDMAMNLKLRPTQPYRYDLVPSPYPAILL